MNDNIKNHFEFPGQYWSAQIFSLVADLFSLSFLRRKPKQQQIQETVLEYYPDKKTPKLKQVKLLHDVTGKHNYIYGLDQSGRYLYQLRCKKKICIKVLGERIVLTVDNITPEEFYNHANHYWDMLPVDCEADTATIEAAVTPDCPRPDFTFNVLMRLRRYGNSNSKRDTDTSPAYSKPDSNFSKAKPFWLPEEFMKKVKHLKGLKLFKELTDFRKRYGGVVRFYEVENCGDDDSSCRDLFLEIYFGPISL